MGRVVTDKNKVKFEIENKQDCILYLGHLIEYLEKKKDVYWRLSLEPLRYLAYQLEKRKGIVLSGDREVIEFIQQRTNTDFDLSLDFYKFKLFNSATNLVKNEMLNVIGDFSADKLAISYNNYLDIIKNKKIQGVTYKYNKKKQELVDLFNTNRNYVYHFSSDKLCEWISYREEQTRNFNAKFEFGKEFNIYISDMIPYKIFAEEVSNDLAFINLVTEVLSFMKKDFEELIGEKVDFQIKKRKFDYSVKDITDNGFESHTLSKNRNNK